MGFLSTCVWDFCRQLQMQCKTVCMGSDAMCVWDFCRRVYGISVGNCIYNVKTCVWDKSQCVYGISVVTHVHRMHNVRVAMDTCSECVICISCCVSFVMQLILVMIGIYSCGKKDRHLNV